MYRIKLPGSNKTKQIILAVLVVMLIILLIKVSIDNSRKKNEVNIKINKSNIIQELENEHIEELKNEDMEEIKKQDEEQKIYSEAFDIFHSGNYDLAISKANELIKIYPKSYKGYGIRGIAKAYKGDYKSGMEDINKSLEIKDDYGYSRFNKALTYELMGSYDESLKWYDKAIEVEEYLWSYYGKASIYGRKGDINNVIKNLEKTFEIARKQNIEEDVKKITREEKDFNLVKNTKEFKELLS